MIKRSGFIQRRTPLPQQELPLGLTPKIRLCRKCGKEFEARGYFSGNRYCSRKCIVADSRLKATCKVCQKEFNRSPGDTNRKYCSRECYKQDHNAILTLTCSGCGTTFSRKNNSSPTKRKFCTRACLSKSNRGTNNPLYRGRRHADRGKDWKIQSAAARSRDDNRCAALCHDGYEPNRKEKLSVDHVVPYRLAFAWHELGQGPDPNILTNLLSMCRSCHAKKTPAEIRLLRGDVIGFMAVMRPIVGDERLIAALHLYGIYGHSVAEERLVAAKQIHIERKKGIAPDADLARSNG